MTAAPIRAAISGTDTCTADGITATGAAPVLALCRRLAADPGRGSAPLHVYRGDTLALRVRSIGEAAGLRIGSHGFGFEGSAGAQEARQAADFGEAEQ